MSYEDIERELKRLQEEIDELGRRKVTVCILAFSGIVKQHIELTARLCSDIRYQLRFTTPSYRPIENARNRTVKKFLESDHDYLLMIDADNPPFRMPLDLVELDLDVVTLPTPVWIGTPDDIEKGIHPLAWNVYRKHGGEGWIEWDGNKEGLVEVDAVGTGCILIARRVLEAIPFPFERYWKTDGLVKAGSDLTFCDKAKEAGFKIWAHWDYVCQHHVMLELCQVGHALRKAREKDLQATVLEKGA